MFDDMPRQSVAGGDATLAGLVGFTREPVVLRLREVPCDHFADGGRPDLR